jgi:hypothetical protein
LSQLEALPLDVWRNSDHQVGSDLLVEPENTIHGKSVAHHNNTNKNSKNMCKSLVKVCKNMLTKWYNHKYEGEQAHGYA